MDAICKMSKNKTTWPCPVSVCSLYGDCMAEYKAAISKPSTNADRIRAMTDDELADLICDADFCKFCDQMGGDGFTCAAADKDEPLYKHCKAAALKWLQQPADKKLHSGATAPCSEDP